MGTIGRQTRRYVKLEKQNKNRQGESLSELTDWRGKDGLKDIQTDRNSDGQKGINSYGRRTEIKMDGRTKEPVELNRNKENTSEVFTS